MIKIEATRAPYWLGDETRPEAEREVVPGVRIKVKPIGPVAMQLAKTAGLSAVTAADDHELVYGGVAFTLALAQWGIVEWDGIGDAEGNPVAPTSALIAELLEQNPYLYMAIDRIYVAPAVLRDQEKNVSSVSLNGGSPTTETPTAPPAKRAAKRAHTRNTKPRPTKAS